MRFDNLFPSSWLKASDLASGPRTAQIESIETKQMNDGSMKPVINFKGATKALVLNVTNGRTLTELYGADCDDWIGKPIQLVAAVTDFQGRTVDCIRLRAPAKKAAATNKPAFDDLDDSIPF